MNGIFDGVSESIVGIESGDNWSYRGSFDTNQLSNFSYSHWYDEELELNSEISYLLSLNNQPYSTRSINSTEQAIFNNAVIAIVDNYNGPANSVPGLYEDSHIGDRLGLIVNLPGLLGTVPGSSLGGQNINHMGFIFNLDFGLIL